MPTEAFGKVPVVILLHYWGAIDDDLEQRIAEDLAKRGVASISFPLPFHMGRTPSNSVSGALAIQPDPIKLRQTMIQSVQDTRRVLDFVESRSEFDAEKIGLHGTSLGALIAELVFAADDRVAAASFLLGGADLAHILWHSSRVVSQRETLRKNGYSEDRMRLELSSVEPLNYLKKTDLRPTYVVGAKYDSVIPPVDTRKLVDALGNTQSLWIDTGHYGGALVSRKLERTVVRFQAQTLLDQGFTAPESFYAPTIRFGLHLSDETGMQVMAGLDIWRLKSNGETFASAMITPRGAQGFLGHTVSKNLAIGITVTPKRTTWGVLWSLIL